MNVFITPQCYEHVHFQRRFRPTGVYVVYFVSDFSCNFYQHDTHTHIHTTFRCHIPVVFYILNTKYITVSQNTTKIIVLCCTICFTTTCLGPFLQAIFRLCTLGLESNVSYIQIYYFDDEISVIIIQLQAYYGGYVCRLLWMGTGFGCGLAGME